MTDVERVCAGCGEPLPPQKRRGNPRKWCSPSCRLRVYRREHPEYREKCAERARETHQERMAQLPPLPKCKNCGDEMKTRRADHAYCGKPQCQAAKRRALLEAAGECSVGECGKPVVHSGMCSTHVLADWRRRNPSKHAQRNARYRARKRDAFVEDVDRDAVLARDGWVCGICGGEIPQNAVYPAPLSPSVDHVVPLAAGGTHEMKNVQASHFICNSKKRDVSAGDQLAIL